MTHCNEHVTIANGTNRARASSRRSAVKTAQRRVAALLVALGLLLTSGGLTACEDPPKQERQPATSQPDERARGGRDHPPLARRASTRPSRTRARRTSPRRRAARRARRSCWESASKTSTDFLLRTCESIHPGGPVSAKLIFRYLFASTFCCFGSSCSLPPGIVYSAWVSCGVSSPFSAATSLSSSASPPAASLAACSALGS